MFNWVDVVAALDFVRVVIFGVPTVVEGVSSSSVVSRSSGVESGDDGSEADGAGEVIEVEDDSEMREDGEVVVADEVPARRLTIVEFWAFGFW